MNRIKILLIFIISLLIFPFIFGIKYAKSHNVYLSELKSQFNNFLYKYDNFNDELPVAHCQTEDHSYEHSSIIEKDKIFEDIDYLFSLFKFGYSGYEFFGGDLKFNSAKENIIWSVKAINDNEISKNKFLDILYRELDFIQDAHFSMGDSTLCNYTKYFGSRKFTFLKDDIGLYTEINNKLYYLDSINGDKP